ELMTVRENLPMLQLQSAELGHGFRGAPVWDDARRRVIGLLDSLPKRDLTQPLPDTALAVPTETMQGAYPELDLSDVCPYQRLEPFSADRAEFFCGRTRLIGKLVESLRREPRFLAVVGPAGSGKSSLVMAGLIPALERGALPGPERWEPVVIRPGGNPFGQLAARGLVGAAQDLPAAVRGWLSWRSEPTRLVLIIDQSEELLLLPDAALREAFVAQLATLLKSPLPATVVMTMRDQFYSRLIQFAPVWVEWLERGLVNITAALTKDELTAIVQEPARATGWEFEVGLAEMIVEEAMEFSQKPSGPEVGHRAVLPLLEFALTELWHRRRDGKLTKDAYKLIGGVGSGLNHWADRVVFELSEDLRPLARRILTELVALTPEGQGHEDTRRPRLLSDLCKHEPNRERIERLARHLVEEWLLVIRQDRTSGQEMVEFANDALLREWALLRRWLREDRRFLIWRQAISDRTAAWVASFPTDPNRRDPDLLLRGAELTESVAWTKERERDLSEAERQFIQASFDGWEHTVPARDGGRPAAAGMRRRFTWKTALALVVCALLAAGVWQLGKLTKGQTSLSLSRELAAVAQAKQHTDRELSLLLALEAAKLERTPQAEEVLRQLLLDSQGVSVLQASDHGLSAAAFSPDGARIVTAGRDAVARVWNARTKKLELELKGHTGAILNAGFSPEGKFVITTGADNELRMWNPVTGECDAVLRWPITGMSSAVISPDGKLVATANRQKTVNVWDPNAGEMVAELTGHGDAVTTVAFSPNGKFLVTASDDKTARVWEARTGNSVATLSGHKNEVLAAVFSPDNYMVATASADQTARLWEATTGVRLRDLAGHFGSVRAVAFSADGKFVVTAGDDKAARVWEVASGRCMAELTDSPASLTGAGFSPDGKLVITAGADGNARIYPWATFAPFEELLILARTRVKRELTPLERANYLHEGGHRFDWLKFWMPKPSQPSKPSKLVE
ncbi:MAG: WD40 repeat domain-containing protein, partial [Verrucomicrobiae bacterium]|nr:WD40 repeat domain-containing protein [Verrucomicrobiae bacterium]